MYDSKQMIEDRSFAFTRIDAKQLEHYKQRLSKRFAARSYMHSEHCDWYVHQGDLVIDGSLSNGHALIIDGNLTIKGNYDDYVHDIGLLVVLGDVKLDNGYSWGTFAVTGELQASGLFYANYNDFVFDASKVTARALLISDKSGYVGSVTAPIYLSSWIDTPETNYGAVAAHFLPELLVSSEYFENDEYYDYPKPDEDTFRKRIAAGLPVFREQNGSSDLLAILRKLKQAKLNDRQLIDWMMSDRLLAAVIAQRKQLSAKLLDRLLALHDPLVYQCLAENPELDSNTLDKVVSLAPMVRSLAVNHKNASLSLLQNALTEGNTEARKELALRLGLADKLIAALVSDSSSIVRKTLVQQQAYRLSQQQIRALLQDPDAEVRAALLRQSIVALTAKNLQPLLKDPSEKVRSALVERLRRQVEGNTPKRMSAIERQQLAEQLLADNSHYVRYNALLCASESAQKKALDSAYGKDKERLMRILSASVEAKILDNIFANSSDPKIHKMLAKNLSLSTQFQLKLFEHASSVRHFQDVIEALLENPNVAAQLVEQATAACVKKGGVASYCRQLVDISSLDSEQIERLKQAYGHYLHEDLALGILSLPQANRSQVEWALNGWYGDILDSTIRSLDDQAFWSALAASEQSELREAAAINSHTPAEAVRELLAKRRQLVANQQDKEDRVFIQLNPNLSEQQMDQLIQFDPDGGHSLLANPAITNKQVQKIYQQALLRHDVFLASKCLEWLGARERRSK